VKSVVEPGIACDVVAGPESALAWPLALDRIKCAIKWLWKIISMASLRRFRVFLWFWPRKLPKIKKINFFTYLHVPTLLRQTNIFFRAALKQRTSLKWNNQFPPGMVLKLPPPFLEFLYSINNLICSMNLLFNSQYGACILLGWKLTF
jgi:hypothetical protein